MEYMKIKQEGRRLIIRTEFENDYRFNPHQYLLVISCPKISFLSTNATYRSYNKEVTDTIVREDWKMRQVLIDGFAQDTLHIVQDYGSTVILDSNHIGHIYARIGKSQHSGSNLIIQNTNHFQSASIYIENQSKLFLDSATIGNLDYHLADSARLIIDGRAINLLNNSKNLGK